MTYQAPKPATTITFQSPINLEGSWGQRNLAESAECMMELYFLEDGRGYVNWDIPDLDLSESIGLTFEYDAQGHRRLTDYDGVMTIPDQVLYMLRAHNVDLTDFEIEEPETPDPMADQTPPQLNGADLLNPGDRFSLGNHIWRITALHYAAQAIAHEATIEPVTYTRELDAPAMRVSLAMLLQCRVEPPETTNEPETHATTEVRDQ